MNYIPVIIDYCMKKKCIWVFEVLTRLIIFLSLCWWNLPTFRFERWTSHSVKCVSYSSLLCSFLMQLQHTCTIWNFLICFQLVILFGREGSQEANMGVLLRMVTSTTLTRASADLWNHTDAVQGCLALLTATFKKTPHLLTAHHNHLAPLFHLGKLDPWG